MRRVGWLLGVCWLLLLATVNVIPAELLEKYDVVGTDPAGDAVYAFVGSNQEPTGQFAKPRVDILAIEMGGDAANVHVKLVIGQLPSGTSSYMYYVQFKTADKVYFTCWNGAYVANNFVANAENTRGCSKFVTSGGQVGPTLLSNGVDVRELGGQVFVRWEVPRTAIAGAPDGTLLTEIFATTYVRGVSNCCVGSQNPSEYVWNQGDRAPNADSLTYVVGGPPEPEPQVEVSLSVENGTQEAAPGESREFAVTVANAAEAPVTVSINVTDWPDLVGQYPLDVALGANSTATVNITLVAPSNATAGEDLAATVQAYVGNVSIANLTLHILVVEPEPPESSPMPTDSAEETADSSSTGSTDGNGTAAAGDDSKSGIPGPGVYVLSTALAAAVAALRRRRA